MSKYRTPLKDRAIYTYYDAYENLVTTLRPGENGITEADIAGCHRLDDDEWNNDYQQARPHKANPQGTVSLEEVDPDCVFVVAENSDPAERVSEETAVDEIYKAIRALPTKQANAILAVCIGGKTARAYAKEQGISEAAVSRLISRARETLGILIPR